MASVLEKWGKIHYPTEASIGHFLRFDIWFGIYELWL